MNQTLTQIQEEFDEKFTYQKPTRKYGKILYATPVLLASVDEIKSFLTQSNLRVLEKVKTRILSGMKPYTIKADKSVRVADLTTEQFESIVNSEEFWCEDESDLSTLIEQK